MQNNKVHKRFRYVVLNLLIVIFLPELSVFDQAIARGRLPLGLFGLEKQQCAALIKISYVGLALLQR